MKILMVCAFQLFGASLLWGAFETWTNHEGNTAQLDLVEVNGEGDTATGTFRTRAGKTVTLGIPQLSPEDGERLLERAAALAPAESVFDALFDKNLVKLEGRGLKRFKQEEKPTKFYVFYYTASWCGPCQAFTPELVKFYNRTKKGNSNFELVLISSDRSEDAMVEYAKDKKMPWPQLRFSKVNDFRSTFNHGVSGIPAIVVCDLEGNIVSRGNDLNALSKLLK